MVYFRLKEDSQRFNLNLEVQLMLKQGQVEVDTSTFVHDYKDSALIHRSVVEELNSNIKVSLFLSYIYRSKKKKIFRVKFLWVILLKIKCNKTFLLHRVGIHGIESMNSYWWDVICFKYVCNQLDIAVLPSSQRKFSLNSPEDMLYMHMDAKVVMMPCCWNKKYK